MAAEYLDYAIIVDIDGTLADCNHRRHFMQQEKKDWKSFYEGMNCDTPNGWCEDLMARYMMTEPQHVILLVSGRPDNYKKVTEEWLAKWQIDYDGLMMRKEGDFRPDTEVKLEIYKQQIAPKYDVQLVVDDRSSVVKMWRSQGLVCLQCADGDF